MKITDRDIDLMGWILEQKFMTRKQIRRIFWKGLREKSTEDYRRLGELKKAGYLKASKRGLYKEALYLVAGKGVRQIRDFSRDRGLREVHDADYSNYRHDLVVTDIRIMFHELGYRHWLSERVLFKGNDLRRVPDGVVYHGSKYFAIEYESSQKSKRRYREIFYNYELDNQIGEVIYIVDTPELIQKLLREADACVKLHFVTMEELQKNRVKARLRGMSSECSLRELLDV